jgi:hypothetical protein
MPPLSVLEIIYPTNINVTFRNTTFHTGHYEDWCTICEKRFLTTDTLHGTNEVYKMQDATRIDVQYVRRDFILQIHCME